MHAVRAKNNNIVGFFIPFACDITRQNNKIPASVAILPCASFHK